MVGLSVILNPNNAVSRPARLKFMQRAGFSLNFLLSSVSTVRCYEVTT